MRGKVELMAKHYCFICLMMSILSLCPFAFASEDTPSPFPDNLLISDLPELPAEPEIEKIEETQTPILDIAKEADEVNNTQKQVNAKAENDIVPLVIDGAPAQNNDIVSNQSAESNEPAPIFLPKSNNVQNAGVKTQGSLTDTLKGDAKPNIIEGTWIEKLASVNPLSAFNSNEKEDELVEMVKKSREKNKDGRSNAAVFDISGIMLRMSLNQVEKTMKNRGFQKINAKFTIPNFIKWRNEETCSSQGIIGFERLQSCIASLAKKDGHEYVYYLKYAKFDSKEEIEVFLTSNFTDNKVHKIMYRSKIPEVAGNSPKATYIRNIKIYDFWKKINQKYGNPDNKANVTWGLGGNKPFLKAATGYLLLEDPMFVEMDYTRMSREDQRYVHSDYYNF